MDGDISYSMFEMPDAVRADMDAALGSSQYPERDLEPGRVIQLDRTLPLVCTPRGNVRAEHTAALKKRAETLSAVGDWVAVAFPPEHGNAVIFNVLPRSNSLSRPGSGRRAAQVLASNIDVVFVVTPAHEVAASVSHLEREIALAMQSGADVAVVLSKADLCDDPQAALELAMGVSAGSPVVLESAEDGTGTDEVLALIGRGRCAVMLGKSGVGKSSLANAMLGLEVQRTSEVRASDGKGRHTTIARRMLALPGGGFLIDTPGLRSFLLLGSSEGVSRAFPEISELALGCRFSDCSHTVEPGCAVRGAVESGELDERRYRSFLAAMQEVAGTSDRR